MKALVLFFILSFAVFANSVWYSEEFENEKSWNSSRVDNVSFEAKNKSLTIVTQKDEPYIFSNYVDVFPNDSSDFMILSSLEKLKGESDRAYGIIFGFKTISDYYAFDIRGDGSYRYYRVVKEKEKDIIPWTRSIVINRADKNIINIRKMHGELIFYINGKELTRLKSEKNYYGAIGFWLDGNMKIKVGGLGVLGDSFPTLIDAMMSADYAKAEIMIKRGDELNLRNRYGETPLILAAKYNRKKLLRLMLRKNVDISIKDNEGYDALHRAVESRNREIVKILLKYKADPNTSYLGKTVLMTARELGDKEIIETLLKYGAKDNKYHANNK